MFKKLFNSIPLSRLLIYLALLATTPLVLLGMECQKRRAAWGGISERILALHTRAENKARKQSLNNFLRKKYRDANSLYLDHQITSLHFLKKERESLDTLIQNPSFTGSEAAEKRYLFLSGEANRMEFIEGSLQSGEGVQETTEILAHPVEVDTHDLKEILARIEGARPGKPQLLITDFKLNKKTHASGNQVFELNLKLIKREFTLA